MNEIVKIIIMHYESIVSQKNSIDFPISSLLHNHEEFVIQCSSSYGSVLTCVSKHYSDKIKKNSN